MGTSKMCTYYTCYMGSLVQEAQELPGWQIGEWEGRKPRV